MVEKRRIREIQVYRFFIIIWAVGGLLSISRCQVVKYEYLSESEGGS